MSRKNFLFLSAFLFLQVALISKSMGIKAPAEDLLCIQNKQNNNYPVPKNNECAITTMLVKRINKSKKAKIKQCYKTNLNSTNSLVPQQRHHKYFVGFPLQLLFVPLFLRTNIFKGNLICRKAHRIVKYLKIKTDESEYRTQGTNVSLS